MCPDEDCISIEKLRVLDEANRNMREQSIAEAERTMEVLKRKVGVGLNRHNRRRLQKLVRQGKG